MRSFTVSILPERKKLRLQNFNYAENGYYFLTLCTEGRKQVLSEIILDADKCACVELKSYGEVVDSYIRTIPGIDKYVIMPNHVHMIIRKTNGKNIASDVRSLKILVTKKIGESIWQTSYYDHIIRNESDYAEKWRYIDENPAKWADDEYNT